MSNNISGAHFNRANQGNLPRGVNFGRLSNANNSEKSQDAIDNELQHEDEAPVTVNLSAQGRLAALQIREFNSNEFANLDVSIFSEEARNQRRAESEKQMNERLSIDPFDNEFQILGVTHEFNVGTLESFIQGALEGRAKNASLVASELGQMIRSAANNNGATAEERAVNREIGMRHAEYIAQNFFDNPDEAQAFLDSIQGFYDNDVLREKGYTVIEGSGIAPFRSYTMPNAPKGHMSLNSIARHFGASDEILNNPEKLLGFVTNLFETQQLAPEEWRNDIVESFEENEQKITDMISHIRQSLNENDVSNSLTRLLRAF